MTLKDYPRDRITHMLKDSFHDIEIVSFVLDEKKYRLEYDRVLKVVAMFELVEGIKRELIFNQKELFIYYINVEFDIMNILYYKEMGNGDV